MVIGVILFSAVGLLFCIPLWIIAFILLRLWKDVSLIFTIKDKKIALEKRAVSPDIIPEVNIRDINERLDSALASRREPDKFESHVQDLGKEVDVDHDDSSDAVNKIKNIGK